MSVPKLHHELSKEVTACEVKIGQLEKDLVELRNEYNVYVKTQENRSYNRSQQSLLLLYGLVSSIVGGIVTYFLTNWIVSSG